jgi:dihydrofolate reductase
LAFAGRVREAKAMARTYQIDGYAIVSADGMIADAAGLMPETLKYEADQHYFQSGLDGCAAVIQGRHSYEGLPRAALRKRLVLTRRIATIAPDPDNRNAMLWNPMGASLDEALGALGVNSGRLGIVGGTEVFGLFLRAGYDVFHLSRTPPHVRLPGGRPAFPPVPGVTTPEQALIEHGLTPGPLQMLDPKANVTVTVFKRQPLASDTGDDFQR